MSIGILKMQEAAEEGVFGSSGVLLFSLVFHLSIFLLNRLNPPGKENKLVAVMISLPEKQIIPCILKRRLGEDIPAKILVS